MMEEKKQFDGPTLDECRQKLDVIDAEIVALFQKRMHVAEDVARYKKAHGLPVLDASREDVKLAAVAKLAEEDMAGYTKMLYNEIMRLSREHQKTLL